MASARALMSWPVVKTWVQARRQAGSARSRIQRAWLPSCFTTSAGVSFPSTAKLTRPLHGAWLSSGVTPVRAPTLPAAAAELADPLGRLRGSLAPAAAAVTQSGHQGNWPVATSKRRLSLWNGSLAERSAFFIPQASSSDHGSRGRPPRHPRRQGNCPRSFQGRRPFVLDKAVDISSGGLLHEDLPEALGPPP